jgi:hypothetical protein
MTTRLAMRALLTLLLKRLRFGNLLVVTRKRVKLSRRLLSRLVYRLASMVLSR